MTVLACALLLGASLAQQAPAKHVDVLLDGFRNPPQSARPYVWWHWMNGNISKEGIRADLEWMSRIGLGGLQVFDAALTTPQIVDRRIEYMTPEWKDDFRYALHLSDQLGLSLGIAGSPGWSETGGPWVTPQAAMKKYVWSETAVEGGKPFSGVLVHPPTVTGKFQNTPFAEARVGEPSFYADAAVIAFRTPADEVVLDAPRLTSSSGAISDARVLNDDNAATSITIGRAGSTERPWLLASFARPVTVRSVSVSVGKSGRDRRPGVLEASEDGTTFHEVTPLPMGGAVVQTLSFAPVTARFFRASFDPETAPEDLQINEFTLRRDQRVHHFEEKAAFQQMLDLYGFATPAADAGSVIQREDIVDLSGKLRPDGTLPWTPPEGHWTVLRIGYSLLGTTNHPATKEATGLEVDKLDHRYVQDYLSTYLNSYRDTVGAAEIGARGIRNVITDSWEAGTQNWTDKMLQDFRQRRGYDPTPWLPVLAGHIVESSQASDRFLWDFRKTIADLTADEHYGQIHETLKAFKLDHYGESHEGGRAFIADGMEVKKRADVPMGAMWTQPLGEHAESFRYNADDRESASVAHVYGQNIAAAESLTAKVNAWGYSPATLRSTIDQEFLNGINRVVIHESTHQPVKDKVPGLTLGIYGQWFNRNETWAEQARPWIDYIARSSYLLQQGRFAADVLYFYGEDSNITAIFRDHAPSVPEEYAYDYINADGLMHDVGVAGQQLTTASGMRYRLLVLDPYSGHMSLPVLQAISKLVQAGAIVVGPKPTGTPSLADDPAQFAKLSTELFGEGTGHRRIGRGEVYAGSEIAPAMHALGFTPDFTYSRPHPDTQVGFVHRHLPDGEVYFVSNRSEHEQRFDALFRVTGQKPELWHADTGAAQELSYRMTGDQTLVPLQLEPWGSAFVVFRHRASVRSLALPAETIQELARVPGPWRVSFQPGRGAPESITMDELASWSASTDAGVKYFSGTGTYVKAIEAPRSWFSAGTHLWLDLGDVKNLAQVKVNGQDLGVVWHAPYRVDMTSALHPGLNQVTINVIDSWVNRLVGDQQPGARRYTYTDFAPYNAGSPLLPAGLLGPVVVLRTTGR